MNATLLAIEEINSSGGVLDRMVEPVIYDPASDPKQFRSLAERLLQVDRIRLLFGCYMSSTRKAVLPVVESHRGLLFYPTLYEGFEYSRHCIYTGAAPNQNSLQLARFLLSTYGNRFLLVGSNYIYPYESNRLMADFVAQGRGEVLDEIYVPLEADSARFRRCHHPDQEDVSRRDLFDRGRARHLGVLRGLSEGRVRSGQDADREPDHQRSRSSRDAPRGRRRPYHRRAVLRDLIVAPPPGVSWKASRRKYGPDAPVPAAAEAAYFQVHLAMRALARCGSDDPERVLKELRDSEFDAPQGRVRIDPENNHTYLWPRIARLDKFGRFQTVWNPGVRIKPDPYCVVQSLDDWSVDDLQTVSH